jgi:hypothetical protein
VPKDRECLLVETIDERMLVGARVVPKHLGAIATISCASVASKDIASAMN